MTRAWFAALFTMGMALGAAGAQAADWPERTQQVTVDVSRVPACDNPRVLHEVADSFQDKESTYWNSDLKLIGFSQTREMAYRPWGVEFVERRFCHSRTTVSDHVERDVYYVIGYETGTLGITWGVEFCVIGLDRNLAYSPACKMAQPGTAQ